MITRRIFLKGATAGWASGFALANLLTAAAPQSSAPRIRIGSCRIGLKEAKQAGLDGVEIGVGGASDRLRIADPSVRKQYKNEMAETGLVISSFMMGVLNSNPLATDPRGPAWLEQSIDAAQDLGAQVILVAFFGKANLLKDGQVKQADVDVVVERLKDAAPRAAKAGVILGIENTLSGRQNAEIVERIGHSAVRVYYDVGNSTRNGYDVPAEIHLLKDQIAIFHFKDGRNYLGEGQIKFKPIAAAMRAIGYKGWIVMETSSPSKNAMADAKRNGQYIRQLFG